jgi:hypothetical protein
MNNTQPKPMQQPAIDSRLQARLGVQLRKALSDTALQPIPDRLQTLLDRLEKQDMGVSERACGDGKSANEAKT